MPRPKTRRSGGGIIPGFGIARVELRACKIELPVRIEGNRRLSRCFQPLHAVIADSPGGALHVETFYHPGFAIVYRSPPPLRIERKSTKRWSRIRTILERDIGEQRHSTSYTVDLPDRTGTAILIRRTPLLPA